MENTVLDELLNLFLNDGQEVDGQLPNPHNDVELPDDVVKDIWKDYEADYWVSHNKDNPVE